MIEPPVTCLVLADTHLRPGRALPDAVLEAAAGADVILHAGDVVDPGALDDLGRLAPVHAVLGNNDHPLVGRLPERLEIEIGGVRIGMVHDSGTLKGRDDRMRRWFPDADVVVYGHSHEPDDHLGEHGQRLFNPGSPTDRRRQPHHSYGILRLAAGEVVEHRIVTI